MPKKRVWNQEEIDKIIKLYTEDFCTIGYIAKQIFHCRDSSISKILKDNNIQIRNNKNGRIFNLYQEKEIIDLYLNKKLSQKEIANKYSCCTETIHKILIRNNIEIKTQPRKNKEQINNFFEKIDTEEKAYFLGFLFADGCVYKNQISLEIHNRDRYLLEKFKEILQLNSKISYRKRDNTEVCCIRISSEKMCKDLNQYGIVQNKTYITKHLPHISIEFLPHFLRGLIDGDGWISIDKNKNYHIGFVSYSQSICEDFQKYCNLLIKNKNKSKITLKDKNGHSYCCQIQGKESTKQLATVLYKDNNICLSRKYRLVEPLFDFKDDEDIV